MNFTGESLRLSQHAFTVEEANEQLPNLRRVLRDLREVRDRAQALHERLQLLGALWGDEVERPANPDHEEFERLRQQLIEATDAVQATVESEIRARGIRFPAGGLEHGLIDFPTRFEGRWVYLCWHSGEARVGYWHELDAGYRGRRPITEEQARVMGRADGTEDVDDSVLDF